VIVREGTAFIDKSIACDISSWMTPPRVEPIIPISRKEPFDDPEWLFDLKYDGFRALLYFEGIVAKRLDDPYDPPSSG
jgi:ATP-dependent DNA ligase